MNSHPTLFALLALAALAGCSTASPRAADPLASYRRALGASRPERVGRLERGSAKEKEAVAAFIDFYADFSQARVKSRVADVYARDAFFRDPFREVAGIGAVEEYFLSSTSGIDQCSFEIQDWAEHEGEYYFRWVMNLRLKRDPADLIHGVGMTHLRFDPEGRVIFQQDYWDAASTVYERLPVLGAILRWIRSRA